MSNDQDFQQFVCQQLQELSDRHNEMDEKITKHIEATQQMADIVMMGKSLFMMANWVGKGLRVVAYCIVSAGGVWAAIKGFGK